MPSRHVVKPGECLSRIAQRYGLADCRTVHDHTENEALRQKRPDPNVLHPGDVVVIPDMKRESRELATGSLHRVVVKRPRRKVRIRVLDAEGARLDGFPFVLTYGAQEKLEGRRTATEW